MGSNTPKRNRNDQTTAERTLIGGLVKHATEIPSMVISGSFMTNKDLVATVQTRVDSAQAVLSTRASWLTAVQAERDERAGTKTYVSGLRQALLVAFGNQVDTLADFGLTARALHVRTPEERLAVAAKGAATRAARHTMGARQKKAIHGSVAAKLVVTPETPPSGSTPVASPEPVGNAPAGVTPVTPHTP
jgi:hypothetical protein